MDKYPLIGVSICAVVLLILGSLTNVVGYQSVKSTVVNDSPLFRTRTLRATNQQQYILTSQYLGKGYHTLLFPLRDNITTLIQKVIERIRAIDDETFDRFIDYAVNQITHKNNLKAIATDEFVKELRQIRESKQNIIVKDSDVERYTIFPNWNTLGDWFPGLFLFFIIVLIILILYKLFDIPFTVFSACFCIKY